MSNVLFLRLPVPLLAAARRKAARGGYGSAAELVRSLLREHCADCIEPAAPPTGQLVLEDRWHDDDTTGVQPTPPARTALPARAAEPTRKRARKAAAALPPPSRKREGTTVKGTGRKGRA